jgi:hypothetical protein
MGTPVNRNNRDGLAAPAPVITLQRPVHDAQGHRIGATIARIRRLLLTMTPLARPRHGYPKDSVRAATKLSDAGPALHPNLRSSQNTRHHQIGHLVKTGPSDAALGSQVIQIGSDPDAAYARLQL